MDKVYRDKNWYTSLMYSFNKRHGYYAYIDGRRFLATGEIVFKDSQNPHNKGMPSKVDQHILDRTTIIEVQSNSTKENIMESNVNYIGGEYKVAKVRYFDGGTYNFKADVDLELNENTLVVVESKNGLGLARVVSVYENCIGNAAEIKKATAWIVDVVDMTSQDKRKEATRQREYIIQQLDEKKAQMEAISVYALLAKTDPEANKLLEQLASLGS